MEVANLLWAVLWEKIGIPKVPDILKNFAFYATMGQYW